MEIKKLALLISIFGTFFLLFSLNSEPKTIDSLESLEDFEINEKVSISGVVLDERVYGDFKIIKISGIEIICSCKGSYLNEKVEVIGVITEFNNKRQITALKINPLN